MPALTAAEIAQLMQSVEGHYAVATAIAGEWASTVNDRDQLKVRLAYTMASYTLVGVDACSAINIARHAARLHHHGAQWDAAVSAAERHEHVNVSARLLADLDAAIAALTATLEPKRTPKRIRLRRRARL